MARAKDSLTLMTEQMMFDMLTRQHPNIIDIIRKLLAKGHTPKQIETLCRSMVKTHPGVGGGELTMNAIYYAACHIKAGH